MVCPLPPKQTLLCVSDPQLVMGIHTGWGGERTQGCLRGEEGFFPRVVPSLQDLFLRRNALSSVQE